MRGIRVATAVGTACLLGIVGFGAIAFGSGGPDGLRYQVASGQPAPRDPVAGADVDPSPDSLSSGFDDAPMWPGEPWTKDGQEVSTREISLAAGPEHCSWQEAVFLGAAVLPAPRDGGHLWSRDPQGVLTHHPRAQQEFQARATLPADAGFTGYAQGPVELWVAPSDGWEYVYLVNAENRDDVERWVQGGGGCA